MRDFLFLEAPLLLFVASVVVPPLYFFKPVGFFDILDAACGVNRGVPSG